MKRIIPFFILFFLILALPANTLAQTLVVLGGGGEPKGEETIFDKSLEDLGKVYQEPIWEDKFLSFNSGHSTTEAIIKEKFGNPSNIPFTTLNFYSEIEKVRNLMEKKKTKKVMLYIDTHGQLKSGNEQTHHINTIEENSTVGLDELKKLSLLAKQNGIQLAIIDQSCHSGNSLALANEFTCVISATSPDLYSYGTADSFSGEFLKLLKPGMNLEEAFLKARLDSNDAGFPMISTKESQTIVTSFYEKLVPYLYKDEHFDEFTKREMSSSNSCLREKKHDDLMNIISEIEKIKSLAVLSFMKILLDEYHKTMDQYIKNEEILNGEDFQKEVKLSSSDGSYKDALSLRKFLMSDYDEAILEMEKDIRADTSKVFLKDNMVYLDFFKTAKMKQDKIKKDHPEYEQAIKQNIEFKEKLDRFSSQIANESKRAYHELYSAGMTFRKAEETNPCRDFVL